LLVSIENELLQQEIAGNAGRRVARNRSPPQYKCGILASTRLGCSRMTTTNSANPKLRNYLLFSVITKICVAHVIVLQIIVKVAYLIQRMCICGRMTISQHRNDDVAPFFGVQSVAGKVKPTTGKDTATASLAIRQNRVNYCTNAHFHLRIENGVKEINTYTVKC
jgi:hypothetical protein